MKYLVIFSFNRLCLLCILDSVLDHLITEKVNYVI